jgi:predicted CXXCH cytochrome family protein
MKYNLLILLSGAVILFPLVNVSADTTLNRGPKTITLKTGANGLKFNHHKHQKIARNECWDCHDKSNNKIKNWGKAYAHKICIPCHELDAKGPVKCKECHKK